MGTRRKLKFPVLGKTWYSGWQRTGISSQGDLHSGVKQSLEVPLTNGRGRPVLRGVRICQHFLGVKRTAPTLQQVRINRLSKKGFFHPGRMLREDVIRLVKFERGNVGDSTSLHHPNQLSVNRLVSHAVGQDVDSIGNQGLSVTQVEHVRRYLIGALMRFVYNRMRSYYDSIIDIRRHFGRRTEQIVYPQLDHIRMTRS